ncbi:DUF6985 domain-containing protein [Actinomadura rayongensis]|uniref:DUF6985 domain-containing protein n=1 Tax=Actinomadura rayongensis TaxID=1429076 RepID=A0A6I4W779_9ACTN|nr:hypothetical protein [Actinomadura rayongensis]MXQ65143.1 hypothetical protein [Actinomadura rayongensis]
MDFVWQDFFWTTTLRVAGKGGSIVLDGIGNSADAPITLAYAPEGGRDDSPLTPQEIRTVREAIDALPRMWEALQPDLLTAYEDVRAYPPGAGGLPPPDPAAGVRPLVDLTHVTVHPLARDGRPYVGLEFACPWDDGDGVGVLMNGDRVVEVGPADTAALPWLARHDAAG